VIVPLYPVGWAAGSYILKLNSIALGAHSASAGYTVDWSRQWQGISSSLALLGSQSLTSMRAL